MLKSEEHTLEVLASSLNEERRRRRAAEKGRREAELRVETLERKVEELRSQLATKMDELSGLMRQMIRLMTDNGAISLSESVKESVIAGVRAEYERREAVLRHSHELEVAALHNEINSFKDKDGGSPSSGSVTLQDAPSLATRLKSAGQRKADPAVTAYGQHTESGKFHHGSRQAEDADTLDPEKEPELLKAVNYALKEYPCILHCLEDGTVDFSNNGCERQIRRIAKYRNNSFFVGSPEAGKRFARLQSIFENIRNHKLNPQIYLCDVFRRIKDTAKEEPVNLLPHRWKPGILPEISNY